MLTTWIDANRHIQVVQRRYLEDSGYSGAPDTEDLVEIEVTESAGLLTIFVRQLAADQDPVAVKFVGPQDAALLRDDECEGHPAGPYDPMGETVYCDGSCKVVR